MADPPAVVVLARPGLAAPAEVRPGPQAVGLAAPAEVRPGPQAVGLDPAAAAARARGVAAVGLDPAAAAVAAALAVPEAAPVAAVLAGRLVAPVAVAAGPAVMEAAVAVAAGPAVMEAVVVVAAVQLGSAWPPRPGRPARLVAGDSASSACAPARGPAAFGRAPAEQQALGWRPRTRTG